MIKKFSLFLKNKLYSKINFFLKKYCPKIKLFLKENFFRIKNYLKTNNPKLHDVLEIQLKKLLLFWDKTFYPLSINIYDKILNNKDEHPLMLASLFFLYCFHLSMSTLIRFKRRLKKKMRELIKRRKDSDKK